MVGIGRLYYVVCLTICHILLARSMGPEIYGSFQRVWLFSGIFLFFLFGIPESMYYLLPRIPKENTRALIAGSAFAAFLLSFLLLIVLGVAAPFLGQHFGDPLLVGNLRIFGTYGALLVLTGFIDPVYITFKRARYHFYINVFHGFFLLALAGFQYLWHAPLSVIFVQLVIFGILRLITCILYLGMVPLPRGRWFSIKPVLLKRQLLYALPIGITAGMEVLSRWLDKMVVSVIFDRATLAVYAVGALEIPAVGVFLSSVTTVILPVLNRLDHEGDIRGFTELWRNVIRRTASVIWPIFLWLILFANPLITLVFTDEYARAVPPFRAYLLMLPLRVAIFSAVVYSLGRPTMVLLAAALTLAVNFVLSIILAYSVGYVGPAVATTVSTYFHVGFLAWIIARTLNTKLANLIPIKKLLPIAQTALIAGIASLAISILLPLNRIVVLVFSLITFAGVYIIVGRKWGLFSE